jgi:hypothetical protein
MRTREHLRRLFLPQRVIWVVVRGRHLVPPSGVAARCGCEASMPSVDARLAVIYGGKFN